MLHLSSEVAVKHR